MLSGLKLGTRLEQFNGGLEYVTKGGCQFAKWRCVYVISEITPSRKLLKQRARILAQYAVSSQQVLCDGEHELEKVTEQVPAEVYKSRRDHSIYIEGTLMKPNMVMSGSQFTVGNHRIPEKTLRALTRIVPAAVPEIVFLSGGQLESDATKNLNEINQIAMNKPWKLFFQLWPSSTKFSSKNLENEWFERGSSITSTQSKA